ncbi:lysylphosphatidylglycerol synthase transmembrane domain-containing protein [Halosimplex pelagicum]|uniref:Flippase-like domain-containing protein n=1 Tax=Halosimplex pelagicum TaxID=869886 RepID=A0A7D5PE65_9EURY|nr:lysylphosphatidylglycerol synthase transmembrane domain-containing protein [Halosimplex pelagicum]QLH81780.1 flippase-like domain-containing protein [Halosimplex pelagicum]
MRRILRVVLGFALALLAVGGFLWIVGPRQVLDELTGVDPATYAAGFLAVVAAFYCWSEALRRLLASVGGDAAREVGGPRYRAAFMSGEFLKQVVPMGHSGGPVFVSYAVSKETDAPYEEALAAATVVEFVNIASSVALAGVGIGVVLLTSDGPITPLFVALLVGFAVAVVALGGAALLVNSRRALVERLVLRAAGIGRATVGRLSGRARAALAADRVAGTFGTYYAAFDRALADRAEVRRAAAFSLAGWALFLAPMYTSFRAIGEPVPYALVVFVVPVLSLVNVVPLPGGLGGFEVALAAVVVALVGLELPAATAGVFLYRLSNYWFVVLLGGLAAAWVSTRLADPPSPLAPTPEPDGSSTESATDGE